MAPAGTAQAALTSMSALQGNLRKRVGYANAFGARGGGTSSPDSVAHWYCGAGEPEQQPLLLQLLCLHGQSGILSPMGCPHSPPLHDVSAGCIPAHGLSHLERAAPMPCGAHHLVRVALRPLEAHHLEGPASSAHGVRHLGVFSGLTPCDLCHFERLALVHLQPLLCSSQLLSILTCPLISSR